MVLLNILRVAPKFTVTLDLIFSKVQFNSKTESESPCLSPLVVSKLSASVPPIALPQSTSSIKTVCQCPTNLHFVHCFPQYQFKQVNNFCWYTNLSHYYTQLLAIYTAVSFFKIYIQLMHLYLNSYVFSIVLCSANIWSVVNRPFLKPHS